MDDQESIPSKMPPSKAYNDLISRYSTSNPPNFEQTVALLEICPNLHSAYSKELDHKDVRTYKILSGTVSWSPNKTRDSKPPRIEIGDSEYPLYLWLHNNCSRTIDIEAIKELIKESEACPYHFEALEFLCVAFLESSDQCSPVYHSCLVDTLARGEIESKPVEMPIEIKTWLTQFLRKQIKKPKKKRGADPDALWFRDRDIAMALFKLQRVGTTISRGRESPPISGCDALILAVGNLKHKGIFDATVFEPTYTTVEGIWNKSSKLRSPPSE